ncbi:4-alpha-glucanotransferase, partial [Bifidobacteriaceae bacterium WP022]
MDNTTDEEVAMKPLHRLAELMGVGVSFIGSDNQKHEIQDNVLVSVLGALGVDASTNEAIEKSTNDVLAHRHGRIIAPTILHTVGKCDEVTVNTGILEYPVATLTLENGEQYKGDLTIVPNENDVAYPVNGKFVATSLIKIPEDVPMGYHTLRVTVGERQEEATLISAPESIDTLNSLEPNGEQLWGWMAQLYSIRSSKSWGVGDFADLATLLTEAKQKTGA